MTASRAVRVPAGRLRRWSAALSLLALCGCASYWEEITSSERDWAYLGFKARPDPLTVARSSDDGARRAQALAELREPARNGGSAQDQEIYLGVLVQAARADREPLCRLAAIRALGGYTDPRAARALEEIYQQPQVGFTPEFNTMIRQQALVSLEQSADPEARHLLIRVARQPGPSTRADSADFQQTQDEKLIAVRALGKYKQPECVEALAHVLKTEKDIALRDRARESIQLATGRDVPDDPNLLRADYLLAPAAPQPNLLQRVTGWKTQP